LHPVIAHFEDFHAGIVASFVIFWSLNKACLHILHIGATVGPAGLAVADLLSAAVISLVRRYRLQKQERSESLELHCGCCWRVVMIVLERWDVTVVGTWLGEIEREGAEKRSRGEVGIVLYNAQDSVC
jgi:hypothetical protein